jgi:hypothetical protein
MDSLKNPFTEPVLEYAKTTLIDYAKGQLINELQTQIQNGEAGIDKAFENLKTTLQQYKVKMPLINSEIFVLQEIRELICKDAQKAVELKEIINKKIQELKITTDELQNLNMPEDMKSKIDDLPQKLKDKLIKLINELIDCNAASTSSESGASATSGGKRNKNTKRKHRKKTKKHYKKSQCRK